MATKPRVAWRNAGCITSSSDSVPWRSSIWHQAIKLPGVAIAARPRLLRRPTVSMVPGGAMGSGVNVVDVMFCGQTPWPSITVCWPLGSRRWAKPPPSRPTIMGSTTDRVNKAATAASTALPPAANISVPAAEARGWLVTTMPRAPKAGCLSVEKGVEKVGVEVMRSA